ncbi:hypothetical protein T492DRAFT_987671 [Pavlovales sp. CCMP2436]|nr:hypothetical protein T492DRAFT_987671 [Pavlovales sp. CCMP2436]
MLWPITLAALAFSGAAVQPVHRSAVVARSQMAVSRRELAQLAGSALLLAGPLAALADGSSTTNTRLKAFTIYGERILKLDRSIGAETAFVESVIEPEKNAFTLFISSAFQKGPAQKELLALQKQIYAAAKADDSVAVKEALTKFIAVGKIRDIAPDNVYARNVRRNIGAPTTAAIAQQTQRPQDFTDTNSPVFVKKPVEPAPAPAAA